MSDRAKEELAATRWAFAEQDPQSLEEIRARLVKTAKSRGSQELITYSELVAGIFFRIPTINGGRGFEVNTHSWSELDRGLIGDSLGALPLRATTTTGSCSALWQSAKLICGRAKVSSPGLDHLVCFKILPKMPGCSSGSTRSVESERITEEKAPQADALTALGRTR